jgi:hypothetical protein
LRSRLSGDACSKTSHSEPRPQGSDQLRSLPNDHSLVISGAPRGAQQEPALAQRYAAAPADSPLLEALRPAADSREQGGSPHEAPVVSHDLPAGEHSPARAGSQRPEAELADAPAGGSPVQDGSRRPEAELVDVPAGGSPAQAGSQRPEAELAHDSLCSSAWRTRHDSPPAGSPVVRQAGWLPS